MAASVVDRVVVTKVVARLEAAIRAARAPVAVRVVVAKRSNHCSQQQVCGVIIDPAHNNKFIMKQTILALIRPKLNLSQPEDQILHLIEHILMSPERQEKIGLDEKKFAKDIFSCSGYISELYCAEYYVVRSTAANSIKKIILSNRNNLCLDKVKLQTIKKILIQELDEEKTHEISLGEQFEKAIYQKKSPALQQPWFNTKKLIEFDVNKNNINKIFKKFNQPLMLFELSFDNYKIPKKIKIEKNLLKKKLKLIHLNHPYQSTKTASVEILIPMIFNSNDFINFDIYRTLLVDYDFGILYKKMRQNGFIYDLSINYNMYANAVQISFSCSKNKVYKVLAFIKNFMKAKQIISEKYLNLIKDKIATNYELDWGNISDSAPYYIKETLLGEFYLSPQEGIKKIKKITAKDINKFHKNIYDGLEKNSITVFLNYGRKVSKKVH